MKIHIDAINGLNGASRSSVVLRQAEEIVVEGWAIPVRASGARAFGAIVVWLDNGSGGVSGLARLVRRPDLARHFGVPDFVHSGFRCTLLVGALPAGTYVLSVFGVQDNGGYREVLNATEITLS